VTISSGTQIIGQFAFSGCPNLKALFFRGDAPSVPHGRFDPTFVQLYDGALQLFE